MRIAEKTSDGDFFDCKRLGFLLRPASFRLFAQGVNGRDAQDITIQLAGESIVLQLDI